MIMTNQPTFATPKAAIEFIRHCLQQNDAERLYSSFHKPTSDFWKDRLMQDLRGIDEAETLESVFLEDGEITSFPEHENILHLGGHDPRTHFLHIGLARTSGGWVLQYIHMCR
jgi:hypothetical protein